MAAPHTTTRSASRLALGALAIAVALAGCTPEEREDIADRLDGDATAVATEAPATQAPEPEATAPAETQAPTAEPEPTQAAEPTEPAATAVEEDVATTDWVPIILALLALVLLLSFLVSAMRRRSDRRRAGRAARSGRLGEVVGTARWIHDQGVPEVQRTNDPTQLSQFWQPTRQRMVALEEAVTAMLLDAEGDPLANALKQLHLGSTALRSAVDGDVATRSQPTVDPEVAQEGARTVQERQRAFGHAIDRVTEFR